MIDTAQLSSQLETVVRAVPGVIGVYPTAHPATTVVGTVVNSLTHRAPPLALVAVSDGENGLSVSARIGVADEGSATDICRRVHDVIAVNAAAAGVNAIAAISVTVASIG